MSIQLSCFKTLSLCGRCPPEESSIELPLERGYPLTSHTRVRSLAFSRVIGRIRLRTRSTGIHEPVLQASSLTFLVLGEGRQSDLELVSLLDLVLNGLGLTSLSRRRCL